MSESLEQTQARLALSPQDAPAPAPRRRRPRALVAALAVLVVGAAGAGVALYSATGPALDWSQYPGTAYRDEADALAGDSMEVVVETNTAAIDEFRQALTDEFGMTFTEIYDETLDHDYNYYGGQSMLYFWNSALLQGEAITTDPDARQKIQDSLEGITARAGGDDFYAWNDLIEAGDEFTQERYGLGEKIDQAHWELRDHDERNGVVYIAEVFDRRVPVGDTFTGDSSFEISPDNPNTLFVSIFASAPGLLSESDRAEFIERVKPYEGATKPAPRE